MTREVALAEYLFSRLAQLGVHSIHGVPGDYNLTCLDYLYKVGLHWVGNANELNAGYAADGYARIKGISALAVSFGVGELSALNAIAGAYAEQSPVINIVGTPPRAAQNAKACLHHTLGDGNYRAFADVYKTFTIAQANLNDPDTATAQLDATLRACVLHSRPVYIELPTDMVNVKVPTWTTLLECSISEHNEQLENEVAHLVTDTIINAKQPMILLDGLAARFGVREEINQLARQTEFPVLTAPFGKGLVDEDLSNFYGVFRGLAGSSEQKTWVDECDLILHFGPLKSDVNTYGFSAIPKGRSVLTFNRYSVTDGDATLPVGSSSDNHLHIKSLLRKMLASLYTRRMPTSQSPFPGQHPSIQHLPSIVDRSVISQNDFWPQVSSFFRSGDAILTETGTPTFGSQLLILPPRTTLVNSFIWLSIGHMLGAAQGVALARRDSKSDANDATTNTSLVHARTQRACANGRTILFVGDGSLQMSAQAISDIVRNRLDIVMFIINNSGYTVERAVHGFHASYNDIQLWRHLKAPEYFGAPQDDLDYPVRTRTAHSWHQLEAVLSDTDIQQGKGLNMIEIVMRNDDAPDAFHKFVSYLTKRNSGES